MYVRKRLIVWPNPFIIVLDMDNTTISPSSLMDRGAKRAWETKAVIIPRQNNNEMNGLFNHHGYEMWRKKIYGWRINRMVAYQSPWMGDRVQPGVSAKRVTPGNRMIPSPNKPPEGGGPICYIHSR